MPFGGSKACPELAESCVGRECDVRSQAETGSSEHRSGNLSAMLGYDSGEFSWDVLLEFPSVRTLYSAVQKAVHEGNLVQVTRLEV